VLGHQPVFNPQACDPRKMRRIVGHKSHVMDESNGGNQEIGIFNQLPTHAQPRIELSRLIEDGLIDHDNAQYPP